MMSSPTTSAQICERYKLEPAVFMALSAADRALFRAAYAADELHVVEGAAYDPQTGAFTPGPPYNNVGPDVCRYLRSVGADPGEPWCAAFGSCMLLDSGVSRETLPELAASVHGWLDWGQRQSCLEASPARGMAGLMIFSPTEGHWCWISDVIGDQVKTIEGNTNPGGSRDGYGVFRRVRDVALFHSFVDLTELVS